MDRGPFAGRRLHPAQDSARKLIAILAQCSEEKIRIVPSPD
jgi:hypothetical protein